MENGSALGKLHSLQLKIALEIKRVCEKNGLRCFLLYGSLLGAVRHHGFIPWDDDMDMGMLRSDYDKFEIACKTDLGAEFLWQSWNTDAAYPFPAGKVRLKGTRAQEKFAPTGRENGIYVDVFPFDAVPDGAWARRVQGWRYFLCKRLLWIKKGYGKCIRDESWRQRLKFDVFRMVAACVPYSVLKARCDKMQRRWNNRKTRQVVTNGPYPFTKESLRLEWAEDLAPVEFEGEKFLAFRAHDAYLAHMYGDYMALPPEHARHGHELGDIDFGPYGGVDS